MNLARLRLAFAAACRTSLYLTLPARVTRRFIMQKARRHPGKGAPTACRHMVSGSISLLCSRFFSPFPHGTGSLSVSGEYLALADGPARFTQDFTCPALLRIPVGLVKKSCTGLSPSTMQLSRCFHFSDVVPQPGPTTPVLPKQHRFGLIPFRSPLLRESLNCFLFLWVLRCFSSPRSPPELTG